ncbi:helicase [Candidatus Nitromaritima sp. SCGC AAA799-C22]|nr:helicase [Candidatus Nitromaritima sp. SCGC AAA799-C22]
MFLDNKNHGKVSAELIKAIGSDSALSILSGFFSIYGYSILQKELSKAKKVRLLLSKWQEHALHDLTGTSSELRFKNRLDQHHLAKECASWLSQSVEPKAYLGTTGIGQNLYLVSGGNGSSLAIQGSSNFTASGLGEAKSDSYEMNMAVDDSQGVNQLISWFDTLWNDGQSVRPIKDELIKHLEFIASDKPGNLIYFLTLFNLFKDYLEDIDEESIIRSKTGFKDTLVWNKLYKFQKAGVLGAIDKIEKYNGCIIADSVGLGKTFEALAVIKYYELRNDRVLVLCPKKLRENWTVYTINDKRNLLAKDRFNYDVLNHTDMTRTRGKSGEINLETLNWGNYDLIVIDESHNFRNNDTKSTGMTRYHRLMEEVIRSGVKTKVLMLSATPVNSRMNDLKNQVAFITEGHDAALDECGITSIENTLRKAQTRFNQWLKLPEEQRKAEALLESMNFDYFKLLDLLTIARSRKHIEKYYDSAEIGKFPERLKPMNLKTDIDIQGEYPPPKEVNMAIKKLNLAAYAPLEYVRMDKREEYSRKYDQTVKGGTSVLRQLDRERSLIHLMRVNLLKRMESSIHSFGLTVDKILAQVDGLIEKIDAHSESEIEELSIEEIETDDPAFEDYLIGNKVKVLIQDIDLVRWKQDLEEDKERLSDLLEDAQKVTFEQDAKLKKLKEVITDKIKNPLNEENKKLLIFTAFSDTAGYLYQHISEWAFKELGLHSALVTGTGTNKCTIKGINKDLNNILTNFSPLSKEREKIDPEAVEEIDILIGTDCISEGQNLQDCDMLINYDIHWNPVRIIQRFGRIDRLGSRNTAIQLANFWPNMELDEYINLIARVSGRMVLLDISATGEENVIEYDEKKQMNDLEYRRKQMEQLQESVLDLEDMEGSVSITDMTLNDFRMDLSAYMKDNQTLLQNSPTGFYAVANTLNPEIVSGTIFCLRDVAGKVEPDPNYALAPYYLVYVTEDGSIVFNHLQGKKSLDIFKKLCSASQAIDPKAVKAFNESTQDGKDMGPYQYMLERAINSIIGKTEEKGVESLFSRGGTTLTQDYFQGIEDFEVISYLVIKEAA